jgi:hypothetical protein
MRLCGRLRNHLGKSLFLTLPQSGGGSCAAGAWILACPTGVSLKATEKRGNGSMRISVSPWPHPSTPVPTLPRHRRVGVELRDPGLRGEGDPGPVGEGVRDADGGRWDDGHRDMLRFEDACPLRMRPDGRIGYAVGDWVACMPAHASSAWVTGRRGSMEDPSTCRTCGGTRR